MNIHSNYSATSSSSGSLPSSSSSSSSRSLQITATAVAALFPTIDESFECLRQILLPKALFACVMEYEPVDPKIVLETGLQSALEDHTLWTPALQNALIRYASNNSPIISPQNLYLAVQCIDKHCTNNDDLIDALLMQVKNDTILTTYTKEQLILLQVVLGKRDYCRTNPANENSVRNSLRIQIMNLFRYNNYALLRQCTHAEVATLAKSFHRARPSDVIYNEAEFVKGIESMFWASFDLYSKSELLSIAAFLLSNFQYYPISKERHRIALHRIAKHLMLEEIPDISTTTSREVEFLIWLREKIELSEEFKAAISNQACIRNMEERYHCSTVISYI